MEAPVIPSAPRRRFSLAEEARGQVLFNGALWLVIVGGAGTFASCYGHNCDGSYARYGQNPGEGEPIDADHWESNPALGNALPYTRERTIFFDVPAFADRVPATIETFISADQNPTSANGNETSGSGNLAEVSGKGPGRFAVTNNTCADYYVRVVAFFAPTRPPVPGAGTEDAGDAAPSYPSR